MRICNFTQGEYTVVMSNLVITSDFVQGADPRLLFENRCVIFAGKLRIGAYVCLRVSTIWYMLEVHEYFSFSKRHATHKLQAYRSCLLYDSFSRPCQAMIQSVLIHYAYM